MLPIVTICAPPPGAQLSFAPTCRLAAAVTDRAELLVVAITVLVSSTPCSNFTLQSVTSTTRSTTTFCLMVSGGPAPQL